MTNILDLNLLHSKIRSKLILGTCVSSSQGLTYLSMEH